MKYRKKPVVIEAFKLNARGLVGEDWFCDYSVLFSSVIYREKTARSDFE